MNRAIMFWATEEDHRKLAIIAKTNGFISKSEVLRYLIRAEYDKTTNHQLRS